MAPEKLRVEVATPGSLLPRPMSGSAPFIDIFKIEMSCWHLVGGGKVSKGKPKLYMFTHGGYGEKMLAHTPSPAIAMVLETNLTRTAIRLVENDNYDNNGDRDTHPLTPTRPLFLLRFVH